MLSKNVWLAQSRETRAKIASFLSLPRSSGMIVEGASGNQRIVSDGYTDDDLSRITTEVLIQNLGEDTLVDLGIDMTNFYDLFNELVRRMEIPPQDIYAYINEQQPEPLKEEVLLTIKEPEVTSLSNISPELKEQLSGRKKMLSNAKKILEEHGAPKKKIARKIKR